MRNQEDEVSSRDLRESYPSDESGDIDENLSNQPANEDSNDDGNGND